VSRSRFIQDRVPGGTASFALDFFGDDSVAIRLEGLPDGLLGLLFTSAYSLVTPPEDDDDDEDNDGEGNADSHEQVAPRSGVVEDPNGTVGSAASFFVRNDGGGVIVIPVAARQVSVVWEYAKSVGRCLLDGSSGVATDYSPSALLGFLVWHD